MRKLFKLLVFVIPISAMLASCYPGFDATVEELDIAITKYDSTQDFTKLSTFYLYDTIVYIGDEEDEDIDGTFDDLILQEVQQNLQNLGWTEVTDTTGESDIDVSIMISALRTDISYYYYYWWDYWYWYPWYPYSIKSAETTNYYYPGYPMYPWYPGGGYTSYSYTVGSVLIDMVNNKNIEFPKDPDSPSGRIPIIWTGGLNGILSGSDANIAARLEKQIGQVFKQSTYLSKKEPK
ncbi:MAG: DUF4136 domain-containing protein [Draconibacterium sp.]|nr:DUF4136 domain-containing protein [Draconibacterium sp.]